jgi:hypothetical protein
MLAILLCAILYYACALLPSHLICIIPSNFVSCFGCICLCLLFCCVLFFRKQRTSRIANEKRCEKTSTRFVAKYILVNDVEMFFVRGKCYTNDIWLLVQAQHFQLQSKRPSPESQVRVKQTPTHTKFICSCKLFAQSTCCWKLIFDCLRRYNIHHQTLLIYRWMSRTPIRCMH